MTCAAATPARIPRSFQLAGHTFQVRRASPRRMRKLAGGPAYGLFKSDELCLYVTTSGGNRIHESVIMQTFWHEFFHALYWTLGRGDMHDNEELVDQCGAMLHQALSTMTYPNTP